MFAAGSSLAYLVEAEFLERELIVLGRENADWSASETRSRMHSVISRAKDASEGETVEWQGHERDPRYRLTNQRIIDDLNITTAEEKEMKVIISNATKRQRDRERKERERRSKGAKPRDEYLDRASKKRSLAYDLRHRQGMSYKWNVSVPLYGGVANAMLLTLCCSCPQELDRELLTEATISLYLILLRTLWKSLVT